MESRTLRASDSTLPNTHVLEAAGRGTGGISSQGSDSRVKSIANARASVAPTPPLPQPLPQRRRAGQALAGGGELLAERVVMTRERIAIPVGLHGRMVEVARDFRKAPTPSERRLWSALRRDRLGVSFRRQQPIGPFVVDLFCPGHSLIVEVDGRIHESQRERDAERQTLLETCGYHVVRFSAEDVEQNLPR